LSFIRTVALVEKRDYYCINFRECQQMTLFFLEAMIDDDFFFEFWFFDFCLSLTLTPTPTLSRN